MLTHEYIVRCVEKIREYGREFPATLWDTIENTGVSVKTTSPPSAPKKVDAIEDVALAINMQQTVTSADTLSAPCIQK